MKHRAKHGRSTLKGIGIDDQCIEGQWFNRTLAQDSSAHS
jgi:hypothetical protein